MIRIILSFIIFAAVIHFVISGWRSLNGKEKLDLTKSMIYSIMISLLAFAAMITLVILF